MLKGLFIFVLIGSIIIIIGGMVMKKFKDARQNDYSNIIIFAGVVLFLFSISCFIFYLDLMNF